MRTILSLFLSLAFLLHCLPTSLRVTYRPAGRARTISSDVVACSSILTGAALLTLRPMTTGGAALSTAVATQVRSQMSDKNAQTNIKWHINIFYTHHKESVKGVNMLLVLTKPLCTLVHRYTLLFRGCR